MPLEHSSPPGRAVARRRWYRPAYAPLPAEPGRLVVCALLFRARRARGCVTRGDDRLETRAYAVKRYLFRLGHAARSGRYACSIEQLVVGLAPVMGWGAIPSERVERARFVRAHRRSVQRWLDDLQAAGVVAHQPERDNLGRWWRTQIVLLAAPEPERDELAVAERRARAWSRRERHRQRRPRQRSLTGIRRRSGTPDRRSRARLARSRALGGHERRRRAAVEQTIAAAYATCGHRELLTHPFGAPPTSAQRSVSPERSWNPDTPHSSGPATDRSAPTPRESWAFVAETDARTPAGLRSSLAAASTAPGDGTEEIALGHEPDDDLVALVARRLADRRDQEQENRPLLLAHAQRRAARVLGWPAGRPCPVGRLREAWVAYRHGVDWVAEGGSAAAGARSALTARRASEAISLYERFAAWRPPGWPEAGPAALLALAGQRRADVFAGDVARLLILARQMRAAALEHDEHRRRRQAARAARRAALAPGRLAFRASRPRWESPEQRRQCVRDLVLIAGKDPSRWPNAELVLGRSARRVDDGPALTGADPCDALDGIGGRAARYRDYLAAGRYQLAPDSADKTTTTET